MPRLAETTFDYRDVPSKLHAGQHDTFTKEFQAYITSFEPVAS